MKKEKEIKTKKKNNEIHIKINMKNQITIQSNKPKALQVNAFQSHIGRKGKKKFKTQPIND